MSRIFFVLIFVVVFWNGLSADDIAKNTLVQKLSEYVVVDIRDKADFNKASIAKSINIPLNQIKLKRFLRSKKIVLVDYSFREKPISEISNLTSKGFNISWLIGGYQSWVLGKKVPVKQKLVGFSNFFKNGSSDWHIILFTHHVAFEKELDENEIKFTKSIDGEINGDIWNMIDKAKDGVVFIFIDADGSYQSLKKSSELIKHKKWYALEEGLSGFYKNMARLNITGSQRKQFMSSLCSCKGKK